MKLILLYHILNGDCITKRCESSWPSPDRTACLCVADGFSSPLSITSFVVNLLKDSTPSDIITEDLLLVVQSTGDQSPYENRLNLRRQVLLSLKAFLSHCQWRAQRDIANITKDPFRDLFMGFEDKRKPVLESVMNHHGLIISRETKLSLEDMRHAITSHIISGHCARSTQSPPAWFSQKTHGGNPASRNETKNATCNDFVRDAGLHPGDDVGNEIKLLSKVLDKSPFWHLLLRFLCCKDIPHEASQSRKSL